ncbi:toll receptor 3 [Biomphalaria glabrata]|nr:toll receptor 3 [Biomphalaria glabrata]
MASFNMAIYIVITLFMVYSAHVPDCNGYSFKKISNKNFVRKSSSYVQERHFGQALGSEKLLPDSKPTSRKTVAQKYARQRRSFVHAMRVGMSSAGSVIDSKHLSFQSSLRAESNCSEVVPSVNCNATKCIYNNDKCDCQHLNLTCIPTNLHTNITSLKLGNNSIREVPGYVFCRYTELKSLSLARNKISHLYNTSFCGLGSLTHLDLRNNHLSMVEGTFPALVFQPLTNLTELRINKNNQSSLDNSNYPDVALSQLTNLETLYMDGLTNKTFGPGFKNMTRLKNLSMTGFVDGYCNMGSLNYSTFENVPTLTFLNISNCHLMSIYSDTFSNLTNLKVLDLHYNENLGIDNFEQITASLKKLPLEFLDASTIESRYATGKHVKENQIQNLPLNLTTLKVAGNSIETVDPTILTKLPPNLLYLDVGKNKFEFGAYLQNLTALTSLKTLTINGEDYLYDVPTTYPYVGPYGLSKRRLLKRRSLCLGPNFTFPIPPRLEVLEIVKAGLSYKLTSMKIDINNTLKVLKLDQNFFPQLDGPLINFDSLENLSISNSFVQTINRMFFSCLNSLRNLTLSVNMLGDFIGSSKERLFENLSRLSYLDLSFNSIDKMQVYFFHGLSNVTEIDLSRNKISEFNVDITKMNQLRRLNLSDNKISRLFSNVTDQIDRIRKDGFEVQVDLSKNPIDCTCANLEFLKWMVNWVNVSQSQGYLCKQDDGSILAMPDGYFETVLSLNRQCASNVVIFLIIIGATLVLACVIVGMIIYRFRWSLRYWYHVAYLNYQQKRKSDRRQKFEYDVFISYVHNDETFVAQTLSTELEKRHVKVYMHGQKFVAGNYIASNIVQAVKSCRKTLVVLTNKYVRSQWCYYEVQMANMEAISSGRPVLVFLIKEKIPNHKLGEILTFIKTNTYIPYPQEDSIQGRELKIFYDKLASDLL